MQQMGQLNAAMAQQSMQATGVTARRAMVAAGGPYAAALGALATPAIGAAGFETGIQVAARYPTLTTLATNIGNALADTTVPRLTAGAGGAAIVGTAGSSAFSQVEAEKIQELNTLFGQKVQDNAGRVLSALGQGDYSGLRGWLTPREYNATMRALAGDLEPRIAQANVGKVIERMVARDVQTDPRTSPFFQWVSGPNRADFYGTDVLEGFYWDVTTVADQYAHEYLRWYSPSTFVHAY
jgi:hypothetical protein